MQGRHGGSTVRGQQQILAGTLGPLSSDDCRALQPRSGPQIGPQLLQQSPHMSVL